MGVGLGRGGGKWEVWAQGAAWNSKMGKETSAAFIWKLAWKLTLSLLGTQANTKFSEPNTLFNQPLKPAEEQGGKGGRRGGLGSPFIWVWFRRRPKEELTREGIWRQKSHPKRWVCRDSKWRRGRKQSKQVGWRSMICNWQWKGLTHWVGPRGGRAFYNYPTLQKTSAKVRWISRGFF